MKQKIPFYGIWFIRGQGGRADEDRLVLLSAVHISHYQLLQIQKMDVDLWICYVNALCYQICTVLAEVCLMSLLMVSLM